MRPVGSIGLLAAISALALACQDPVAPPVSRADVTAPSVPGGVTATALSASEILVSWTAASDDRGVSEYRVERDGALLLTVRSGFVQDGDPLRFSITDRGLAERSAHSYVVRALDFAGNISGQSARAVATTYPFLGGV